MAEERIDIIITERGSRVVKRNVENIGTSARKAEGGVNFLKKALLGLGAALSAREIVRLLDTYTNLQNRLRAVGLEGQKLTLVYNELLGVANDTRSSFEGSVELYSRLALSSKELGVSQQQLIDFTKSLNQAILLSGASAQEANAGLIQLSQGMASGTLRGDELRSVLEQLPAVADVIAKELGITRGELRLMGEEGKISANIILDAFKNARVELEDRFAKSVPTISQSFQVLQNNIISAVGDLDKILGVSQAFSKAILALAGNIPELVSALGDLGNILLVVGAAYTALIVAQKASAIAGAVSSFVAYRKAIAASTVVVLGSAEAERQKAAAVLQSAVANSTATGQAFALARAEEASALARLNNTRAVGHQLAAERSLEVVRLQAQISTTGRTQSLARLAEIRTAEAALLKVITREELALNAARTAGVAADNTRAASITRLQQAQKAGVATTVAAAGTTSLLGQAVTGLRVAFVGLFAVLAANPITALVVALVAVVAALTIFRDEIKLGVDDITTLGDLFRAVGQLASEAFSDMLSSAKETMDQISVVVRDVFGPLVAFFDPLITAVSDFFDSVDFSLVGIIRLVAKAVDGYVGLWVGAVRAVVTLFLSLPGALKDIMTQALNGLLGKIEQFVNGAGELLSSITELAGFGKIEAVSFEIENGSAGKVAALGKDVALEFSAGFDSVNFAEGLVDRLVTTAQDIAKTRKDLADATEAGTIDLSAGGGGVKGLSGAQKKELDSLVKSYDKVFAAQQEYKEGVLLLDAAEKAGAITTERKNEILELMTNSLKDALDPLSAINRELAREKELLGLTSDEREISNQLYAIQQDLLGQGVILNEQELTQLREKLELMQKEVELSMARDQILQSTTGARDQFITQLSAINELVKEEILTRGEANAFLVEANSTLLQGTIEAQQAWVTTQQETYAQIDSLRQADLISEQTAAQLKARANAELNAKQLANASSFFGNLASLSSSGNKKLAAIGKAAAVTQATIDGVVAVQKALASAPPPANFALAAAVGIQAAVNVSSILSQGLPGFAFGGDFRVGGQGGTDSQTVAFRATPGETVSIKTPTQNREGAEKEAAPAPAQGTRIVNVLDPNLVADYLNSSEGEQVLVNVIRQNSDSMRNVLAEG